MASVYRSAAGKQAVERRYRDYLERSPVEFESRSVATREGDTFVLTCGPEAAAPAVLLHGAATNSTIWLTESQRWSRTRRLYLVDVIGEPGLSAPSRPSLRSDAYAGWLDDILDGLCIDAAAFVGASLGGWLATDYALRRPARVERLALRAPAGIGRQKYGAVIAALFLVPWGDCGRRTAVRTALGPTPVPDELIDYMALIQRAYRPRRDKLPIFDDTQLRALAPPLLVSVGALDRMIDSHETVQRLRKLLPHADLRVLEDTGHAIMNDRDGIHRFLDEGASSH